MNTGTQSGRAPRYRATVFHGPDECWTGSSDDLLALLMSSNAAMAKERRGRKGPVDGGALFDNGKEVLRLHNEHWVRVA